MNPSLMAADFFPSRLTSLASSDLEEFFTESTVGSTGCAVVLPLC